MPSDRPDARRWLDEATALRAPPLVPELRLHLADPRHPLWGAAGRPAGAEDARAWLAPDAPPVPYWAFAWAGGQALARWLLDDPAPVRGRRVLDFACGSGLAGLAAARAGAARVLAVDLDPTAAEATRRNARANGLAVEVAAEDLVGGAPPAVDVVLAGDVCYEPEGAGAILRWLRALAASGREVYLGDPGRPWLPRDGLRPLATFMAPRGAAGGWVEDAAARRVTVYRLDPDPPRETGPRSVA